ncbi:hypothetical protein TELCIR_20673, partial [Teladorsagia circumcincta]
FPPSELSVVLLMMRFGASYGSPFCHVMSQFVCNQRLYQGLLFLSSYAPSKEKSEKMEGRYSSGRPILNGLTMEILVGKKVATLGGYGLGKVISVVPQGFVSFHDKIFYILAYGDPSVFQEDVFCAARLEPFVIQGVPNGCTTIVVNKD